MSKRLPNGTIVEIFGTYKCIGQICDCKEGFAGRFYDVFVLESDLFKVSSIQSVVEDVLIVKDDYRPKCDI